MSTEIARRLNLRATGSMLPFAVFDAASRAVGMMTYMNIDAVNKRVEIGGTWQGESAQRTPLNKQCKRLLLCHAFDVLDCIAVEFRTHRLNTQSHRTIERMGAHHDGILRSHTRPADGTLRDTAVYGIAVAKWPAARSHLDWQLAKPRSGQRG